MSRPRINSHPCPKCNTTTPNSKGQEKYQCTNCKHVYSYIEGKGYKFGKLWIMDVNDYRKEKIEKEYKEVVKGVYRFINGITTINSYLQEKKFSFEDYSNIVNKKVSDYKPERKRNTYIPKRKRKLPRRMVDLTGKEFDMMMIKVYEDNLNEELNTIEDTKNRIDTFRRSLQEKEFMEKHGVDRIAEY